MRSYWKLLLPGLLVAGFMACKSKQAATADLDNPILGKAPILSFTEAIAADPRNAANYYQRGRTLHRMGQDSFALNDYIKATKLDSTKAEYFSAAGDLLFEHKDISGSLTWLQRAMKLNPNDIKAHLKLAKVMLFTKEYPKAFTEINTVLRQDAYNPEGYFLKGLIYKDLKDTNKAISSFRTAINVAPDYREAFLQLGLLHAARRDPLGLKYLDNAFRLDTSDVLPIYAKGMYYQEQQQYEQAKEQYHQCIARDQQYADAYFSTGWILLQQDSIEKARRQFDLVTKIDPVNANAWYNRGLCSEMMNDNKSAAEDYRQALTFDKDMQVAEVALKRVE